MPELIGDKTSAYITGPDGLALARLEAGGDVRYLHPDQLGSTRALSDQSGALVARYDYGPYGEPTRHSGEREPFGYVGQYTDAESGLQYLRARYYDPATLSFISRDPLAARTRAPYHYANDSPTNYSDPSGLGATGAQGGGSLPGGVLPAAGEGPSIPLGPILIGTGGAVGAGALALAAGDEDEADDIPAREGGRSGGPTTGAGHVKDLPARGKPNSTAGRDDGSGHGQIRDYDNDGQAKTDYDFGHDHGAGDPHAHDWDWGKRPPRQSGRPIRPGE